MYKQLLLLTLLITLTYYANAQSVGVNNPAPDASAVLDVFSTNKGVLIPRILLTATNVAAPVVAPFTSLLVYNTATAGVSPNDVTPGYYYWNGTKWVNIGGDAWKLAGNAGTTAGTNFIGTIDAQDLVLKTNNIEAMRILGANSNVGIGVIAPTAPLQLGTGLYFGEGGLTGSSAVGADIRFSTNGLIVADKTILINIDGQNTGTTSFFAISKDASNDTGTELMRVQEDGNVGIGTNNPKAVLDVTSTSAGFAMPRMTSPQRKAITAPFAGLQVFDTDLKGFYYYTGTKWDCVSVPAGSVGYFANITAPDGYLECNGQAVSTTTYAELFAAIGYLYGGAGALFNVPDLRGEFVRGIDNTRGADVGRAIGTAQAASTHKELGGAGGVGNINNWWSDSKISVISDGLTITGPPTNGSQLVSPYGNNSTSVVVYEYKHRPRNVAMLPCIKF